LYFPVP